ncbi:MAG TPA: ATP-binding protein [Kofleriaceae bacterium]|nr:ATP-binding protein [Kofleriaceae bacterium]
MTRTPQLRTRLAIAGLLLIATTVAAGVWSVVAFRRVSAVVSDTVTANQRITDTTSTLSQALEREDDAVVLVLNNSAAGRRELAAQRAAVDNALEQVIRQLETPGVTTRLCADIDAYEQAVDELLAMAQEPNARTRYHEHVNPLLVRAVGTTDDISDAHFRSSQQVAEWAGQQSTRSMQIVAAISIGALLLLMLNVLHFARVVMKPIGEMTRAVEEIRRGDFSSRVTVYRDDELGRLGGGLNKMADELAEFKRTNIGEVIAAKDTLQATLEALPDAVLVIGNDRKVSATNPRAVEALGPDSEQKLEELPVRAAVEDVLQSRAAPDATVDLAKAIELDVGGRKRRLLPRVVPIAGERGVVLVLSDVTELARLDEMRLELVAVASHELRTPLTTMRMTLSMLQEHATSYVARDRELVTTAMMGVEQLSVLVDEFLDLTRIEAGELRLQMTRVSVREIVDRATKAIGPACEQARVSLDIKYGELPSTITGDHARLAMVVSNLLSNALKYTQPGDRIRVTASATTDTATIVVEDSGPGVPAEFRERVFERFFRVEHMQESALSSAGAGIGLYIARQVIEAHGGTIRCSGSPLGGAQFTVTIPVDSTID